MILAFGFCWRICRAGHRDARDYDVGLRLDGGPYQGAAIGDRVHNLELRTVEDAA